MSKSGRSIWRNLKMRLLCTTESNAFDKSIYRISTGLRVSSRFVVVECLVMKACWCSDMRPAASKDRHRKSLIMDAIYLQMVYVKDIGR